MVTSSSKRKLFGYLAVILAPFGTVFGLEMVWAANSPVFGSPLKVLKQSASNFFSGDVIPGRCGLLDNWRKFLFLQSFKI